MRKRSGSVDSKSKLVGFLYVLMRDHMTSGDVEKIMENHVEGYDGKMAQFTNGWLANHAKDLAARLS